MAGKPLPVTVSPRTETHSGHDWERKKLETFRALQSAARRLVGERGLDNVTIEEMADAANVSKRTFFNYFESKEAAIVDPELGKVELLAAELAARRRGTHPVGRRDLRPARRRPGRSPAHQSLTGDR